MTVLLPFFYFTSAILSALCIYIANSISKTTCVCIKHSMVLLVMGIGSLVCSVYYEPPMWHRLLALLIIFWGLIGWLFFDRYMAHRDLDVMREWVYEQIYFTHKFFVDIYSDFIDWLRGK